MLNTDEKKPKVPKASKVPLGKPLKLTDEQLDALAVVTPADIIKAEALWSSSVPPKFKTLLDAQSEEEQA